MGQLLCMHHRSLYEIGVGCEIGHTSKRASKQAQCTLRASIISDRPNIWASEEEQLDWRIEICWGLSLQLAPNRFPELHLASRRKRLQPASLDAEDWNSEEAR